jgi:hypothetical protein
MAMEEIMSRLQDIISEMRLLGYNKTQISDLLGNLVSVRTLRRYELGTQPKNQAIVQLFENALVTAKIESGSL